GLASFPFPLVVPGAPTQELAVEVRNQDRELLLEGRNLVFEVDRVALIGPKENLEDIFGPKVEEVFLKSRGQLAVRPIHEEINVRLRIEDLEAGFVGESSRLALSKRSPLCCLPRRGRSIPRDIKVFCCLDPDRFFGRFRDGGLIQSQSLQTHERQEHN